MTMFIGAVIHHSLRGAICRVSHSKSALESSQKNGEMKPTTMAPKSRSIPKG